MTKPLVEWLRYRFGLELNYVTQMLNRRSFKLRVNGVTISNMSYALKKGDEVQLGDTVYNVDWKEDKKS